MQKRRSKRHRDASFLQTLFITTMNNQADSRNRSWNADCKAAELTSVLASRRKTKRPFQNPSFHTSLIFEPGWLARCIRPDIAIQSFMLSKKLSNPSRHEWCTPWFRIWNQANPPAPECTYDEGLHLTDGESYTWKFCEHMQRKPIASMLSEMGKVVDARSNNWILSFKSIAEKDWKGGTS